MKKSTNGHGTLRRSGDFTQLRMMDTVTFEVQGGDGQTIRIVMIERTPGGAELEVKLSPQDAADFASRIYAVARKAIIQNDRKAATDQAPMFGAKAA